MSRVAMYASVKGGGTNEMVLQHAPLVKRIAYHLLSRLHDSVQIEDLIQSGMLGLLEAIKNYDPTQGASFETYAGIRIRGSMIDEVRRSDWTPRSVHKKSRGVAEAIRVIENTTGREAKPAQIAEHLNISLDEYHQILLDSSTSKIFSVEELIENTGDQYLEDSHNNADHSIENLSQEHFKHALTKAIEGLPERERLVISLYYDEELNLREIGEVLGVSESRVCQINNQAVLRLRSRLSEWIQD